jgi:hypothetical protein
MSESLKRLGPAAIAEDVSGYTAYMNQRKAMQQKQSSEQLMVIEINNLKNQVSDLSLEVQELKRLITHNV